MDLSTSEISVTIWDSRVEGNKPLIFHSVFGRLILAPSRCLRTRNIVNQFFGSSLFICSYSLESFGVRFMNLELIGQLVSVALIVGAGPIIVAALYVRGGNL